MEDIARTAREVDKLFGETRISHSAVNAATNPVIKELLSVQHKNLNSSYEMKRMFGSKVIQAEQLSLKILRIIIISFIRTFCTETNVEIFEDHDR